MRVCRLGNCLKKCNCLKKSWKTKTIEEQRVHLDENGKNVKEREGRQKHLRIKIL